MRAPLGATPETAAGNACSSFLCGGICHPLLSHRRHFTLRKADTRFPAGVRMLGGPDGHRIRSDTATLVPTVPLPRRLDTYSPVRLVCELGLCTEEDLRAP